MSLDISNNIEKLKMFIHQYNPYYFIIWNGEFDCQQIIIQNLYSIYKKIFLID